MKTLMEALMTAGWRLDDADKRAMAARTLYQCATAPKSESFLIAALDSDRRSVREVLSVLSEFWLLHYTNDGKWVACEHLARVLECCGGEA